MLLLYSFVEKNLSKDPSTESNALHSFTTITEIHDPFGMTVDEETSSSDIAPQQNYILPESTIEKTYQTQKKQKYRANESLI
ncbi:unnamed protein product [Parnassius apollo]|uniref:(apollo) hypothetical protein n=1 Tax=Parnassius apollo TaxID=110799 RepID=A0A8S3XRU4_PARAO|nr:unnamed protein product [Parnassius apollo]